MFLSKSDEEISVNRKLAKELVDKWVSNTRLNYFLITMLFDKLKSCSFLNV